MKDNPANQWPTIISVSTWEKPAEALLADLQAQLEQLSGVAKRIGEKLAQEKREAEEKNKPAPVQPLHAKAPDGFLLLNSLSHEFNGSVVETKVLPSDVYRLTQAAELEDFQHVLRALAEPAMRESNRNAIFLADNKGPVMAANSAVKAGLEMAAGKASIGFNVAAVTAGNAGQYIVDLYIIEDKERGKMMVAGSDHISPQFQAELKEKGLDYVCRRDPACVTAINEFLADGAKCRGERGKLISGNTQNVIESMLYALGSYTDAGPGQPNRGITVGKAIHEAQHPKHSAQITRPPR